MPKIKTFSGSVKIETFKLFGEKKVKMRDSDLRHILYQVKIEQIKTLFNHYTSVENGYLLAIRCIINDHSRYFNCYKSINGDMMIGCKGFKKSDVQRAMKILKYNGS